MWFIELPEGTSLWEYTSVRAHEDPPAPAALSVFCRRPQVYNTILKVVFLTTAYAIIYLMRNQLKHTYDKENDTFRMIFCVLPCFILACFVNYYPNPQEVCSGAAASVGRSCDSFGACRRFSGPSRSTWRP